MIRRPEEIELEHPYPFVEIDMRDEALCTDCGPESYPWPADQLMAIGHRHPKRPEGNWRIYCPEHFADRPENDPADPLPLRGPKKAKAQRSPAAPTHDAEVDADVDLDSALDAVERAAASGRASASVAPAPATRADSPPKAKPAKPAAKPKRRGPSDEPEPTPICPNCFVAVSLTGDCSICGERITA